MIITFCGHANFVESEEIKEKILKIFEEVIREENVDFYLGNYGKFDSFAWKCCKEYQNNHANAKLYFVTPYINQEYLKENRDTIELFDGAISMDIENAPMRLKILRRNYEMVKVADFVIAYVTHNYGGAYQTLQYAKQMKKKHINLAT